MKLGDLRHILQKSYNIFVLIPVAQVIFTLLIPHSAITISWFNIYYILYDLLEFPLS